MSRLPEPASTAISFQYLAEIAVGTTTRVDLCRVAGQHRAGELIAVKRLHPHIAEDPGFSTQFLDEVWMTAALKHPNVVEVAGWGSDTQGNYLAFELVQGVSLARLMKTVFETGEVFPERLVVFIAAQLCRGLAAAHALRSREGELLHLVHRDLTPGNVLIGFKGEVKIADFGMAKAKLRMTRTLTGMLKGEPTYMAPEQARGLQLDGRADLFSLGVMLFELFAGRHPWAAATDYEMVHLAATEPPADLRELRPKIDKELVSIVMRSLEKAPASRFQSADEILARLDEWLHAHGYMEGSNEALGRFVRRNAMRQMRWFERAVAGELATSAESLHGGPTRSARQPPRVPTYTSTGLPGAKGRRGRADEEATDITDNAEAQVAAFHGRMRPVIRQAADDLPEDMPTDRLGDEEDGPTIVNKGGKAANAGRARPRAPGPPAAYDIADEESDLHTTSVKLPRGLGRVPGGSTGGRLALPMDPDAEDLPTMPLKAASAGPDARFLRAPGADVLPLPVRTPPPPPPGFRAPPSLPVRTPPPPPPGFGAPSSRIGGALPAPPGDDFGAPPGARGPRTPPQRSGPPPGPPDDDDEPFSRASPPATAERVRAEAERLASEASRFQEEASAAAALADRKAALAKGAAQAASFAAEAMRLVASAGITQASRRLDEALAIERSVQRAAGPPDPTPEPRMPRPPPSHNGGGPPPGWRSGPPTPPPSPPSRQLSSFPPPGAGVATPIPSAPPSSAGPGTLPSGPGRLGAAPIPGSDGMPPSYLRPREGAVVSGPPSRMPAAAYVTGPDAIAFRSRLQPMFFGMPRTLAVIVAGTVFLLVLGLLFLFFS